MNDLPFTTLSHYRLIERIGEGGMGVVWKAQDTILGRTVAIKILPSDVSRDERRRAMFLDEARAASAASHAHVVQVHEFGHEKGLDFIVMELVEGKPLGKILIGRPLPPDKVAQLGVQIALALQAAHRKGLLHRDLKPSNVLVTGDGEVKVVDFGLAALFERTGIGASDSGDSSDDPEATHGTGSNAGTLPYMSPEQMRGEELDARSDVFSLGIVLYEMATGRRPFGGDTPSEIAAAVTAASAPPVHDLVPSVPLELERIITKALARRPGDRYQTMDDFAVDLKRLDRDLESGSAPSYEALRSAPAMVSAPSSSPSGAGTSANRRTMAIAAAAVAIVAVLSLGVWWFEHGRAPAADAKTILVVPFEVRGEGADAYLGQALAEAVAVDFAQVQGLRVLPVPDRTTLGGRDPVATARAAGAGRVLAGSLTRDAGSLHLSLRLLDAADARLLGGVLREESHPDLTLLATQIASELSATMGVAAKRAYEYPIYLSGPAEMVGDPDAIAVLTAWRSSTGEFLLPAKRLAERFPREIGAAALRSYMAYQWNETGHPDGPREMAAANAALDKLDPGNPYTRVFAALRTQDDHPDEARGLFSAIERRDDLTPACRAWVLRIHATTRLRELHYSEWLDAPAGPAAAAGDALREEIQELETATRLDPANPWGHLYLSWAVHLTGTNAERAIGLADRSIALEPGVVLPRLTAGAYALAAGRPERALEVVGDKCREKHADACSVVMLAQWRLHRPAEARAPAALVEDAVRRDDAQPDMALRLARLELDGGHPDKAKAYVERALALKLPPERLALERDLAALTGPPGK